MTEAKPHLDEDIIIELMDIMEDDFGVLLETYLDDAVVKLKLLSETITTGDALGIAECAHGFKGSSLNVGASVLADLCSTLEGCARDHVLDETQQLLQEIEAEYAEINLLLRNKL